MTLQHLPDGFLWGAATAAHKVEGGNVNSDGWVLEHLPHTLFREPSGDAGDFLHRYLGDVATVAALGLNAFRFGVEWARIEPEPGEFSMAALDHYSRVVDACLGQQIAPVVTLHHFTSPRWLIREGGWRSAATPGRFAQYATRVMRRLGDRVEWVCTINEANTPLRLAVNGLLAADAGDPTAARSMTEAAEAFGLPVLVTEHGADLDDEQDHRRAALVEASLRELAAAVADGLDVRGYLHWSLMDNYEWFNGYHGHVGLLGVDRTTRRRWIRPSAAILTGIARANAVPTTDSTVAR